MGGALLTIALLLWFAKDITDAGAQKGVGFGMLASSVGGFVLSVMGVASSSAIIRSKGWVFLALFVVFGLGYAFMLFVAPKMQMSEPKPRRKAKSG